MPTSDQTQSGKAWEYGLAYKFAGILDATLEENNALVKAHESYNALSQYDRNRIDGAAFRAVEFLYANDDRLPYDTGSVMLQDDRKGVAGDVRDIILHTKEGEIGISAKHRHTAVKHSRLSDKNDFGKKWYGTPCSTEYWDAVVPIFEHLRLHKELGTLWRDLPDKHNMYYIPILVAFMNEVREYANLDQLLYYLLGRYDYYKVIKENGAVFLQSFNLHGQLKWGNRLPAPKTIFELRMKSGSSTTAMMYMDAGWTIGFRIHNASSRVEPSLKFDVQLEEVPSDIDQIRLPYSVP